MTERPDPAHASDGLYKAAIEASTIGMLIVDGSGFVTEANRGAADMFGYRLDELMGMQVDDLVPDGMRNAHTGLRDAFFRSPEDRAMGAGTLYGKRADDSEFPIEVALSPVESNGVDGVLAFVTDCSMRIRLQELAARNQELERSNAELEQFAYVASHDLQEPLRMVASYTELLAERYQGQLDERGDKYVAYIVEGAQRMQRLVADLLDYSRVGSQGKPPEPTDSAAVMASIVRELAPAIEAAEATVSWGVLPVVWVDPGQFRQLLENLIRNSLKFRAERPPHIEVTAERDSDGAWLFGVADNGIGIDPIYEERIFEMFQRLHGRGEYEGTGIGLSIAKRIVERHGGRIWFEPKPGTGTTFRFTIPAQDEKT